MTNLPAPFTGFVLRPGAFISYEKYGAGPPVVLVHGSFSDHVTNWEFIKPLLESRFTVYAVARRGRGQTVTSLGHSVEDEAADVAVLIAAIDEPVYLLGHSYGAHTALSAAARIPDRVRKLVLYEAPWPRILSPEAVAKLEGFAAAGQWDEFAMSFFHDCLDVAMEELEALRTTELWAPIIADAPATLGDLRALSRHEFAAERFRSLQCPVLLQTGSLSPRHLYVTAALAAVLSNATLGVLDGQAHEGMTTAPAMYAEAVAKFLLS